MNKAPTLTKLWSSNDNNDNNTAARRFTQPMNKKSQNEQEDFKQPDFGKTKSTNVVSQEKQDRFKRKTTFDCDFRRYCYAKINMVVRISRGRCDEY